jgi:hypothetical protein
MKKLIFLFAINLVAIAAWSQGSAGLIAHWDMNGTVNDVSGNGNNGTAHNITAAVGESGVPNTAWYFNGVNSYISVPYAPALNVTQYSICAKVNVMGFYSGLCGGNIILERGAWASTGCYSLTFDNNEYGGGCSSTDTTIEVFITNCGTNGAIQSLWHYTPNIVESNWYNIVGTYDGDSTYKIYVNGVLKSTNKNTGLPIGTSSDSMSIGMDIYGASSGYPYNFHGIIDDIRFYNRVLADSEIQIYSDSCGAIINQPVNSLTNVGSNALFTVSATISSPTYQWQQDSGTGFVNLTNSGPYSGVFTDSLRITGVTTAMNNDHYRCYIYNDASCSDTSTSAILTTTTGINNLISYENLKIYPVPAKDKVTIQLPININKIQLLLINEIGLVVSKITTSDKMVIFDLSGLPTGTYTLKGITESQISINKVYKY